MILINLLCIAAIVVFVIDLSGFVDSVKMRYWKWLFKDKPYREFSLKPFDCSLCMTHHICLLYAIISGSFSLPIWAFICGLSFLTPQIKGLLRLVSDIWIKAENKIYDILDKR